MFMCHQHQSMKNSRGCQEDARGAQADAIMHDAVGPVMAAPPSQHICHPCRQMLDSSCLVHV